MYLIKDKKKGKEWGMFPTIKDAISFCYVIAEEKDHFVILEEHKDLPRITIEIPILL